MPTLVARFRLRIFLFIIGIVHAFSGYLFKIFSDIPAVSLPKIIISFLIVIVVILGFTTFNLLKKNERQEDILVEYMKYLDKISKVIEISDERLKKIDSLGRFESDDEVGYFFKSIKKIQNLLNEFKIKKV